MQVKSRPLIHHLCIIETFEVQLHFISSFIPLEYCFHHFTVNLFWLCTHLGWGQDWTIQKAHPSRISSKSDSHPLEINIMESTGNNSSAPPPPNMTEYAFTAEMNQVNEKLDKLTQMFMNYMQNHNQSNQDHPNYMLIPPTDQPQAPLDQPQGQAHPTGPSSSTNVRSHPPKQTVIFHTDGQPKDDTYEEEEWRSKGKQKADMSDQITQLQSELRSELGLEVRQLKGEDTYGNIDLEDLCLHPGSKMPPKFKCPELSKYNGKGCPLAHLKLYIGSLSDFIDNEPLLLQLFQRSLIEEALDRMYKKSTETFKQYAHRWIGVAARVKHPMIETEMVSTFISTLKQPYYGYLLGYYASNFATIVHIGDRINDGIKTGKLADYEYLHNMFNQQTASNATAKRPVNGRRDNGKKEGDVQTVMVNHPQNSYAQSMYTQPSYPSYAVYGQPPQSNYPGTSLLKVLNEAHVPIDISSQGLEHLVGQIMSPNVIAFIDEELIHDERSHIKSLNITVVCKRMVIARVLIDNGSTLNICLWVTKASFQEDDWMNDKELMQQLFEEEQEQEMEEGKIEAPPTIGHEDIPALDEEEEFLNQFLRSTDAEVLMADHHRVVKVSDLIYRVKGNYELLNWEITPLTYEAAYSSDTTVASQKKNAYEGMLIA
ncbi:hypothetical protein HHK36_019999 [Tetracentron sinense]|uniref:Uncharacterized protein n=1 Tax=Tetracentron sinense TaxID=13715 RepID=A0A834YY91_TETSI|nr:hypothetical protein HHK36_019999 [Tetracentron sinense]